MPPKRGRAAALAEKPAVRRGTRNNPNPSPLNSGLPTPRRARKTKKPVGKAAISVVPSKEAPASPAEAADPVIIDLENSPTPPPTALPPSPAPPSPAPPSRPPSSPALLSPTPSTPALLKSTPSSPALLKSTPSPALLNSTPSPALLSPTPSSPALLNPTPSSPALLSSAPSSPALLNSTPFSPALLNPTHSSPALLNSTPSSPTLLNQTPFYPPSLNPPPSSQPSLNLAPPSPAPSNSAPSNSAPPSSPPTTKAPQSAEAPQPAEAGLFSKIKGLWASFTTPRTPQPTPAPAPEPATVAAPEPSTAPDVYDDWLYPQTEYTRRVGAQRKARYDQVLKEVEAERAIYRKQQRKWRMAKYDQENRKRIEEFKAEEAKQRAGEKRKRFHVDDFVTIPHKTKEQPSGTYALLPEFFEYDSESDDDVVEVYERDIDIEGQPSKRRMINLINEEGDEEPRFADPDSPRPLLKQGAKEIIGVKRRHEDMTGKDEPGESSSKQASVEDITGQDETGERSSKKRKIEATTPTKNAAAPAEHGKNTSSPLATNQTGNKDPTLVFTFTYDSDSDEDTSMLSDAPPSPSPAAPTASKTTTTTTPAWTQPPPPRPTPAHATLPDQQQPQTPQQQQEPASALVRARASAARHAPARPSGLRTVAAATTP
ncbi:MAG: hypothetical protein M1821_003359, partial [Bathelium mastoideum]